MPLLRRAILSDYSVFWLCAAYCLAVAPFTPGFATIGNLSNVLGTFLPLFLVALAQTLVLISGGIDLSVTSTIGLSSIVGAMAMNDKDGWFAHHPLAAPAGIALMLAVGAAVGAFNGFAIARLRMPAFIVTLGSMMGFGGLAVWLTHSQAINQLPASFTMLGGRLALASGIVLVVALLTHLMLSRSLFGRWLYAVGGNARTAYISGVPVGGVLVAVYVLAGVLAALASVLYTGLVETGSPVLGQNILLDVIGATVIGGTSLFGGKGKVIWTLFGVVFCQRRERSHGFVAGRNPRLLGAIFLLGGGRWRFFEWVVFLPAGWVVDSE
ncbi:MAG: ABC transporter permease [Opitutaceae bacterium]|nr:ABC transporter permease [Opitutaceae bacterium]